MDLVGGGEQHLHIALAQEVGRAMGTVKDVERPVLGERRGVARGHRRLRRPRQPQHIAHPKGACAMPPELPKAKGRARPQHLGRVKAPLDGQIGPLPRPLDPPDGQHRPSGNVKGRVMGHRGAVHRRPHPRPADRRPHRRMEPQRRPRQRHLQRGRRVGIPRQPVRPHETTGVHRPRRRHPDMPEAQPPRQVLHARLRAGDQDVGHLRHEGE